MEERGMGVVLRYQDMNKDTIFLALRKALDDKTRENARQVAFSYVNRPMSPKESAVFWSEYVIKTKGGKLLRPHSGNAHYFIYSMLDIHLFLLLMGFAIMASWVYLVKRFIVKSKPSTENPVKLIHRGASVEKKFK